MTASAKTPRAIEGEAVRAERKALTGIVRRVRRDLASGKLLMWRLRAEYPYPKASDGEIVCLHVLNLFLDHVQLCSRRAGGSGRK